MNIRVPEDVAVVGIDDDDNCRRLSRVPLTTLRQPFDRIATTSVKMMLDRIENPDLPICHTSFQGELIVRQSCGSKIRREVYAG